MFTSRGLWKTWLTEWPIFYFPFMVINNSIAALSQCSVALQLIPVTETASPEG